MTAYGGFPPETIQFLRELQVNNRKDWFDAHRADYEFWFWEGERRRAVSGFFARLNPELLAQAAAGGLRERRPGWALPALQGAVRPPRRAGR
jgi:Conserved hypothetical protein (DUF2461)